jgi:flagellar biosynthesis chaperone FliJ
MTNDTNTMIVGYNGYEICRDELVRKLSDDYPSGYDFNVLRAAQQYIENLEATLQEYRDMVHGNAHQDATYTAIKAGWLNK